ncbi:MAG: CDP-alcohol phosphatidyltransferase family protein [Chloroflexi bacterium]|nr:CDP-alcohol phosphatidyltransferase family protein [Chloroflexota bacterium]
MVRLAGLRKELGNYFTLPLVRLLARTPVTPNGLTWAGFALTVGAAALVGTGRLFASGWVVLFAGLFDMLDGELARRTNRTTTFGGVLDSTLDRLSEGVLLLGLLIFYAGERSTAGVVLAGAVLLGSFLVSYIRARAEGAGLSLQEGWFTRAERVIVLALGLLLSRIENVLIIALCLIAVLSFLTAGQRLFHVWWKTRPK